MGWHNWSATVWETRLSYPKEKELISTDDEAK